MVSYKNFLDSLPYSGEEGWIWAHAAKALRISTNRLGSMPAGLVVKIGTQWYVTPKGMRYLIAVSTSKEARDLRIAMVEDHSDAYKVAYDVHYAAELATRAAEDAKWESLVAGLARIESKELADLRRGGASITRSQWYENQTRPAAEAFLRMRAQRGASIRAAGLPWFDSDLLEPAAAIRERVREHMAVAQPFLHIGQEVSPTAKIGTAADLLNDNESLPTVTEISADTFTEAAATYDPDKVQEEKTKKSQPMLDDEDF